MGIPLKMLEQVWGGAVSEQVGDPGHWAPVAQLDRALAYGARGWGFESLRAHLGPG